jgi:Na+/proline symporter
VVSKYPLCSKKDALKVLKIANRAKKGAKNSLLSQRVSWLEDVAKKLEINKEEIAQCITDEVGKPIKFSRVEVDRCIETVKLSAFTAIGENGELFASDAILEAIASGIKTIVWTDTLQTTFMLASVFLTLWFISDHLNLGMSELFNKISESDYSKVFITDWHHPRFFVKQFVAGMFMSIVMTGMDQDMMQKNLTCRTLKDSQKNMFWMSFSLIPINLIFLLLGAALYIYAASTGMTIPEKSDHLFPAVALGSLGPVAGVTFIIGLVAAAYSSADSALTALTTSFSIDILGIDKEGRYTKEKQVRIRKLVHFAVAFTLFLVIILFNAISRESVINELFKIAGYTYGPLLGLFAFGLFTKYKIYDKGVVAVVIAAPVISYLLNIYSKQLFNNYVFGFELLIINGLLTFAGLFLIRRKTI